MSTCRNRRRSHHKRGHGNDSNNNKEMKEICNLLGISSGIKININVYGHETHLDVYKALFDFVKIDDEIERNNKINNLNSSKLRDIKSKIKSQGKCGKSKEMKVGICKKMKKLKVNYEKNKNKNKNKNKQEKLENDSDSDSDMDYCKNIKHENKNNQHIKYENKKQFAKTNVANNEIKNENDKKEETILLVKSLEVSLKNEFEKGFKLLSNMRIPNDENLQTAYTVLLEKQLSGITKCVTALHKHQNTNSRARYGDIVRARNCRGHIRKKLTVDNI